MKTSQAFLVVIALSLVALSQAHMQMKYPPPLRSKYNPYTTNQDYDMISPLEASGSNFPCKGFANLIDSPQGAAVADWTPGETYNMTITGQTTHNGGSCQASVSLDKGRTWTVIHSYIGNCPVVGDSDYKFTLPEDTPPGKLLFAWTWFNQIGNREMYMNCAAINVKGGRAVSKEKAIKYSGKPLTTRPMMFVANVGNGCTTVEGKDVLFPQQGPDVELNSNKTSPPTGKCGSQSSPTRAALSSTTASTLSKSPASSQSSISTPTTTSELTIATPVVRHREGRSRRFSKTLED